MKKMIKRLFVGCYLLLTFSSHAQINATTLKRWEADKYSMFIHWGIYAELGGVWDGKNISRGLSEQIQAHAGIYSDTYARVAKRFNPEKWNADSIVLLAKAAGMRSVVITSKHHDGFCMFHSKYTDFNVVDATPYKRDVLKELSDACVRHNCKFGLYFSLIDWHYPQASPISSHNSDMITPEHFEFNKKQVSELLTNYGTVSELWFDMGSHSFEQSKEIYELVHRLQPDCMVGSRLGNDMNDFVVMGDNQEPDYIIGVPWQSPASFFDETWGYRSWQERGSAFEKQQEKLASLIRVASRGGNYLLNIGPRGDGSVVEFEKNVLLNIGAWLQKNGAAIYETQADPFHVPFDWGSITSRKDKIYLHVMKLPKDRTIVLPGLTGKISGVRVLANHIPCKYKQDRAGVEVTIPLSVEPDKEFQVIELSFVNGFEVLPLNVIPVGDEKLVLSQQNAFKYYSNSGIDYNSRFQSTIMEAWTLKASKSRKIHPTLSYTAQEKGRAILLQVGNQTTQVDLIGGQVISLRNEVKALTWGDIYLQGPFWSGIGGVHDDITHIDPTKPRPSNKGKLWTKTNWQREVTYSLEGEMSTAYYVLQEIESPMAQQILVELTSGDGVLVALNGKQLLLKNNPMKRDSIKDVVLLDLEKGKNQLVVKLYNNFQKKIVFSIGLAKEQVVYTLPLPALQLQKNNYIPITWRLANPVTPHQTLNLPNMRLVLD